MEPFIGQIIMFGGNFAPRSWALCDGQLLPISQNTALFSILGTTYGGDGRTTFALPDLRGRAPIHAGTGPGLPTYRLGQRGGTATEFLNVTQMPSHFHNVQPSQAAEEGNTEDPNGAVVAGDGTLAFSTAPDAQLGGSSTTTQTGGSQGHNNMPPYNTVNYIIALVGTFPSRN